VLKELQQLGEEGREEGGDAPGDAGHPGGDWGGWAFGQDGRVRVGQGFGQEPKGQPGPGAGATSDHPTDSWGSDSGASQDFVEFPGSGLRVPAEKAESVMAASEAAAEQQQQQQWQDPPPHDPYHHNQHPYAAEEYDMDPYGAVDNREWVEEQPLGFDHDHGHEFDPEFDHHGHGHPHGWQDHVPDYAGVEHGGHW
jgi:hypothetical protein